MKRLPLVIACTSAIACLITAGCGPSPQLSAPEPATISSANSSSEPTVFTIEELAEEKSARIGELQKAYVIPKGGFSIEGVAAHDSFDVGSEILNNVIALDSVSGYDILKEHMSSDGYAYLVDNHGDEFAALSSGCYRDRANDKLYMLYWGDTDINTYKYIVIGGLNPDKNAGFRRIIFEIG